MTHDEIRNATPTTYGIIFTLPSTPNTSESLGRTIRQAPCHPC